MLAIMMIGLVAIMLTLYDTEHFIVLMTWIGAADIAYLLVIYCEMLLDMLLLGDDCINATLGSSGFLRVLIIYGSILELMVIAVFGLKMACDAYNQLMSHKNDGIICLFYFRRMTN